MGGGGPLRHFTVAVIYNYMYTQKYKQPEEKLLFSAWAQFATQLSVLFNVRTKKRKKNKQDDAHASARMAEQAVVTSLTEITFPWAMQNKPSKWQSALDHAVLICHQEQTFAFQLDFLH